MRLSGSTKVHELLQAHPYLEDFLASYNPKFEMLKNRMARATIGRVATLRTAAGVANVDLNTLVNALATAIEERTGQRPEIGSQPALGGSNREQRVATLKEIIHDLHQGGDLESAQRRFATAVEDVEVTEIAAMEESLIKDGLPIIEIQRLCDLHVGTFRNALDQHAEVQTPPGHPVHTYLNDNRVISELAQELAALAQKEAHDGHPPAVLEDAGKLLAKLAGVDNHYIRKENQLFPLLERHGVTGPSRVMWGVHNEIRAQMKQVRQVARSGDVAAFIKEATSLSRALVEMVYKEEKILFPMTLQLLSDAEWAEVRRGEDTLGYVLSQPAASWPIASPDAPEAFKPAPISGLHELSTGALSLEQINLLLTHLPVDLSFVDENDIVRYYTEGPARIFPRSPAVIGREVQNCHPPKSLHMVNEILQTFRSGKKDVAEFWLNFEGKFVHVRYFAVRDQARNYRGCLEVAQDVTHIRQLEGERRLLSWDGA